MDEDHIGNEAETAGKRAEDFGRDAKEKAGAFADRASDKAQAFYDDAKERMSRASDDGRDFLEDAYERGERFYRDHRGDVVDYVEEKPVAALLIAGAVGFGIAWLLLSPRH